MVGVPSAFFPFLVLFLLPFGRPLGRLAAGCPSPVPEPSSPPPPRLEEEGVLTAAAASVCWRSSFRYLCKRLDVQHSAVDHKLEAHAWDFSSRVCCKLGRGGWPSSWRSLSTSAFAVAYSPSLRDLILVSKPDTLRIMVSVSVHYYVEVLLFVQLGLEHVGLIAVLVDLSDLCVKTSSSDTIACIPHVDSSTAVSAHYQVFKTIRVTTIRRSSSRHILILLLFHILNRLVLLVKRSMGG